MPTLNPSGYRKSPVSAWCSRNQSRIWSALAKLLRAHGKHEHADNIDAALKEFADIVASQVGPHALEQALSWAARRALEDGGLGRRAEQA